MRQVSKKKQKFSREYKKVCLQIMIERDSQCQGCGTYDRLSFSHLEPKSYSLRHQNNKEMIHIHCMSYGEVEGCHNKYEAHRFSELDDRDSIMIKLNHYAPDYLAIIQDKIT